MSDYTPIACHIHDYIEIACVYGFEIELILHQGKRLRGYARTTRTGADHHEYLLLETALGEQQIDLSHIVSMRAITPNSHFNQVDFGGGA
jgi:Rho-binding antiterminator